jgi:hypothetical protein
LDYNAQAAVALSTETPDWVQDLEGLGERGFDMGDALQPPDVIPPQSPDRIDTEALFGASSPSVDWFDDSDAAEDEDVPDWFANLGRADEMPSMEAAEASDSPEWLPSIDSAAEPQPTLEELFGEVESDEGVAAPDWLGAATGAEPQASFEDLFGEEEPAEEAAAAPEWLGAAEADAEPQTPLEDLFGEAEPAEEAAAAPEWLGTTETGAEPQASLEDLFGEPEPTEEAGAVEPEWSGTAETDAEPQAVFEDLFGEEEPAEEAGPEPQASFEDLFGEEEPAEEAAAVEPDWLGTAEADAEPQASLEDLFGEEEPAEEVAAAPEWLGTAEADAEPQAAFEDLFGEEEPAEEAAVEPEWLGTAEADAEPQAAFEDLFGEEEPAEEAAAAPELLGTAETGAEPQASLEDLFEEEEAEELEADSETHFAELDVTPSGFTDLLQNIETVRSSASLPEDMGVIEPTPPDWLAAFESDVTTSMTQQEETVVESADEQFDWSAFEDTAPEPESAGPEIDIDLSSAEIEEQLSGSAPDWMIEPELDFFAPASDDLNAIAPAESPDIQLPEEDDWLGSFARAEPVSPEPPPSIQDVDQIRETDEWLAEMPDLELEAVSEPSLDQPVSFDEVEEDLFGVEETERDLETGVQEAPDFDEEAAPAWMADLEPIDEALPEPDMLAEAYDPFEAGGPDQVSNYRSVGDTGVLQPDEQPDWMAAFTGEELPERAEEDDIPAQEDELVLDGLFDVEEEAQIEPQPITEGLSDITFDEIEVEEDFFEPDELAPPAEEEGEMPDWLVAITSSEANKLDDMSFEEVEETYSISTADSGVLQPDEQPDWLVQVGEPESLVDEAVPEPDDSAEEDFPGMFSEQADTALAQHDDLAHTKEVSTEDEWTEVDAEDDEEVPADFVFEDVVPAWLRQPKESNLASTSHGDQEIASEMPEWLRDVMEDDDIGE